MDLPPIPDFVPASGKTSAVLPWNTDRLICQPDTAPSPAQKTFYRFLLPEFSIRSGITAYSALLKTAPDQVSTRRGLFFALHLSLCHYSFSHYCHSFSFQNGFIRVSLFCSVSHNLFIVLRSRHNCIYCGFHLNIQAIDQVKEYLYRAFADRYI